MALRGRGMTEMPHGPTTTEAHLSNVVDAGKDPEKVGAVRALTREIDAQISEIEKEVDALREDLTPVLKPLAEPKDVCGSKREHGCELGNTLATQTDRLHGICAELKTIRCHLDL